MKSYYFISGLPRSGSTLLASILRQNSDFYSDVSSSIEIVTDMTIKNISQLETNYGMEENQRKNIMYGIFDGYYKHVRKKVVFDTSRQWTSRTSFLKSLFPYTKILCPVRDIVSILNSFELILSKNPFYDKKIIKENKDVYVRCDYMMNRNEGVVACPWIALQEGYALNPQMIHFIEYENLCKYPEKTMRGVYEFLERPYYSHDFGNVEYSNEYFDKACNLKDLHTIKKKVEYKPPRCILPPDIVEKHKNMNMEFWRKNCKSDADNVKKLMYQ